MVQRDSKPTFYNLKVYKVVIFSGFLDLNSTMLIYNSTSKKISGAPYFCRGKLCIEIFRLALRSRIQTCFRIKRGIQLELASLIYLGFSVCYPKLQKWTWFIEVSEFKGSEWNNKERHEKKIISVWNNEIYTCYWLVKINKM